MVNKPLLIMCTSTKMLLAALTVAFGTPQHQPPHARHTDEENSDDVDYEEDNNSFAVCRPQMRQPIVAQNTSQGWEFGFKLDIPEFQGLHAT